MQSIIYTKKLRWEKSLQRLDIITKRMEALDDIAAIRIVSGRFILFIIRDMT